MFIIDQRSQLSTRYLVNSKKNVFFEFYFVNKLLLFYFGHVKMNRLKIETMSG